MATILQTKQTETTSVCIALYKAFALVNTSLTPFDLSRRYIQCLVTFVKWSQMQFE